MREVRLHTYIYIELIMNFHTSNCIIPLLVVFNHLTSTNVLDNQSNSRSVLVFFYDIFQVLAISFLDIYI